MKNTIKSDFRKYGGGVALDCWTDKARKATYFGLTIYYISSVDGNSCLNDRVLVIRELLTSKKTGDYLKAKVLEYMREFDLLDCLEKNLIFVSDRGTNMTNLMHSFNNIHCFAHMMNNTVGKVFEKVKNLPDNLQSWGYKVVTAVTSIVKYFKASGLNVLFKPALKSNVSTRWNSVFSMLESVIIHWDQITEILKRSQKHLTDLNSLTLDELILLKNFLEPFKKATDDLEASKRPTMFLVYPNYFKIREHLTPLASDPNCTTECKRICILTENVQKFLSTYHGVALFLHPMMKSLKKHSSAERLGIWAQTLQMMNSLNTLQPSIRPEIQNNRTRANKLRNEKKAIALCLDESGSEAEEEQSALQMEIDEYKNIRLRGLDTEKFDLLEWWQNNQSRFPTLYVVSRFIHAIPASSAAAERLFSMAGRLVTFRPNMRSQLVDDILFLRSNLDLVKTFEHQIDNNAEYETIMITDDVDEIDTDYEVEEVLIDIRCGTDS